ncbi:MAG: GerMN domain-containing protein [Agathobacter sp.]|nr:GerMN domain-containing protein [Agathobacter sp.]
MKKRWLSIVLAFSILFSMTGCALGGKEKGEYQVYYLNMDMTRIVAEEYDSQAKDSEELIVELLDKLASAPKSSKLRQTVPSNVEVEWYQLINSRLYINFTEKYKDLTPTEEVLIRAAIARTVLQVPGVALVEFQVKGEPLMTHDGTLVGSMTSDSFVENPGEQINSSVETSITLYFSNVDGTKLVKETRSVHYSTNISMEKLVLEQLIEGPKKSGAIATVPSGTKLISVSTVDGVCYVNFSDTFKNQGVVITEEILLYSIVNSLTELPGVAKVQLSINGDTKGSVKYSYDLSKMYERNFDLLPKK